MPADATIGFGFKSIGDSPERRAFSGKRGGAAVKLYKAYRILPPHRGTCRLCGARHGPDAPHAANSVYYMMRFYQREGRMPDGKDATADREHQ